jgi:arginase family enzyme
MLLLWQMPGFGWLDTEGVPLLPPQRLAYVGLRDLDPGEKNFIRSLGIKAFTMHEVDKHGIGKVRRCQDRRTHTAGSTILIYTVCR